MKRTLLLAFLICLAIAAYLFRPQLQVTPPPPSNIPEAKLDAPKILERTVRKPLQPLAPKDPEATPAYAKKPEGNVVEFRMIDGLAVAYGDVVLGKPDGDFQGDGGMVEVTPPRQWDRPEIPYLINPGLPSPERVEKALDYFRQHTPVRFVPYQGQRDAIVFEPGSEHCFSALGKTGGLQPIKLAAGCQSQEIMHEVMHALGFVHEQSRADRDKYVQIIWPDIEPKYRDQFAIVPDALLEIERGSAFDYHSIMLYEPNAFAVKRELITIRSVGDEAVAPIKEGLSEGDLKRINRLYNLYE